MSPEQPEGLAVLLAVVEALERLEVHYHLGGSYASSIHGVPRQTQDIDLVVELRRAQLAPLVDALGGEFYVDEASAHRALAQRSSFNLVHLASGLKVDLFVCADDAFDRQELVRSRPEVVRQQPERRVMVKSPEDTVLRKLQWFRSGGEVSDRQWRDVLGVVRTQESRLDREYLRRWAQELEIDDLLERAFAAG